MNKKSVIKILSKETNLPKERVEKVLDGLESLILDCLRKGEVINFTGFAKIYPKYKNERVFISFQTGETFVAPPKTVPAVKFSTKFVEKL